MPATIPGRRIDPVRNFRYSVIVPGFASAGFSSVTGLGDETEVIDYREGIDGSTVRKLPGLNNTTEIVLKRGVSINDDFPRWRAEIRGSAGALPLANARRQVIVVVNNAQQVPIRALLAVDAWPSKLEHDDLDATTGAVWMESLTLVHEGLEPLSLSTILGGAVSLAAGIAGGISSLI